ncbi:hypothetical protein [Candidatus Poriferisodalis sp.]|uniref:hypothetical protein n=1 Tax=Candidatus Poriferisodalis sp. TaxID=3101277 RepID=UPI003B0244AD
MSGPSQHGRRTRKAPDGDARDVVGEWLEDGAAEPYALQADLTIMIINGDRSPLTLEAADLVAQATETGWADERLVAALSHALLQDARRTSVGVSAGD